MKLLLISPGKIESDYGGGQVYIKNLIEGFIKDNINFEVISILGIHKGSASQNEIEFSGKTIKELNYNPDLLESEKLLESLINSLNFCIFKCLERLTLTLIPHIIDN